MANPYQILRIQPDAEPEQIEQAYHRMRKLVFYGGAGGSVTEQAVNAAYAVLSDPHRRAMIDVALAKRRRRSPSSSPQGATTSTRASTRQDGTVEKRGLYWRILRMFPFL